MATQIIINSSNFNTESSTFIYTFPSTQALTDSEIGVSTCNIFNSIYNVSAELGTNSIQIMHGPQRCFKLHNNYVYNP